MEHVISRTLYNRTMRPALAPQLLELFFIGESQGEFLRVRVRGDAGVFDPPTVMVLTMVAGFYFAALAGSRREATFDAGNCNNRRASFRRKSAS